MWSPADITAMPTEKELLYAKHAIGQVEIELSDAILLLEQARLRVAKIEKDLCERRAWIAPIRRLSTDVLSLMFELCGEDDWRTPLRIAGTSRLWRHLVLSTPRAWAFPEVHKMVHHDDAVDHFLSYSGQRPLHVLLSQHQSLTMLIGVSERLECLSLYDTSQLKEISVFPRLKHLSIRNMTGHIELLDLQVPHFPALIGLFCEAYITRDTLPFPGTLNMTFPPLQALSIAIDETSAWLDLLLACRSSLVSLRLQVVVDETPTPKQEVVLPVLKCLEVQLWTDDPDTWPMEMKTPSIETYIEQRGYPALLPEVTPIHTDLGSVTQIHISHPINMSEIPLLHLLRLELDADLTTVLSQLKLNRALCSRLEIIELVKQVDPLLYEMRLSEVNLERAQPISIQNISAWAANLPYEIVRAPVSI